MDIVRRKLLLVTIGLMQPDSSLGNRCQNSLLQLTEIKIWSLHIFKGQKRLNVILEVPYYRKLTLHEIKILEINAT